MRPLSGSGAGIAAISLAAFLSGCHTYTVVETPAVGSMVRVHVPVMSALARDNGASRTETMEGRVVSSGDTLALAVITRRELGAYREYVQYDTLRLAASQTSLIETRELSTRRSVLLGSVAAVGVGIGAVVAFNAAGGGGTPEGDDPGAPPVSSVVISRSIVSSLVGFIFR